MPVALYHPKELPVANHIDAIQYDGDNESEISKALVKARVSAVLGWHVHDDEPKMTLETREAEYVVWPGQWVLIHTDGNVTVLRPEIFAQRYYKV